MCGIMAVTGSQKSALPILMRGLKSMEPRGYDSCGVAVQDAAVLRVARVVGATEALVPVVSEIFSSTAKRATVGIGHTRWATHGKKTVENAHPHADCHQNVVVVHNGTVDNFVELREALVARGHRLSSQTDTELIAHLIEDALVDDKDPSKAVRAALSQVRGAYGIVVMFREVPGVLIAVRRGSPLIIGLMSDGLLVASSQQALLSYTRHVIELGDGDLAVLHADGNYDIQSSEALEIVRPVIEADAEQAAISLDGFAHFMLKEMVSQPTVVEHVIRGRLDVEHGLVKLGGLTDVQSRLSQIRRLLIVGCGSAFHAGLYGEHLLELYASMPVKTCLASEFVHGACLIEPDTAVIAISQSGQTRETIMAAEEAKRRGALILGVVNDVGSALTRVTDAGVYTRAGHEQSVASTGAFISQLTAMVLLTMHLGRQRGMSVEDAMSLAQAVERLPLQISEILRLRDQIREVAKVVATFPSMYFLGRQRQLPIAMEGALKLKEVGYLHAEAYAAGEMRHGPLALVTPEFLCLVICLKDALYEKTRGTISNVTSREGRVIVLTTDGNTEFDDLAKAVITIPETHPALSPILATIPLQLLAYEVGVLLGNKVDTPRNLAKVVTVE